MRALLVLVLVIAALGSAAAPAHADDVVELFTAQGCPACPAADAALIPIARRPGVIALSLPVTYWNGRGWRDPLAQEAFTARQRRYAAIGRREAATPQFVVNGRYATNDPAAIDRALGAAGSSGGPAIGARAGWLTVTADPRTARDAVVLVADYDPRPIATPVGAGANAGRVAVQVNVVRGLRTLGRWQGVAARYRLPPLAAGLRRVVLVQSADGGAIVAARRVA